MLLSISLYLKHYLRIGIYLISEASFGLVEANVQSLRGLGDSLEDTSTYRGVFACQMRGEYLDVT
jgi:hypothetical protein